MKTKREKCKICGHDMWYGGLHRYRDPKTNECLVYEKNSGCCGCQGEGMTREEQELLKQKEEQEP